MRSSITRILAFGGLPRVIVLIYLPGYGILAVCLVYLYFDPGYWFYPSLMILVAIGLIIGGHWLGRRGEDHISREFAQPYHQARMAAQVLGPIFCLSLIIMLWWLMHDSPPPKYKSLFSFELQQRGAVNQKPTESKSVEIRQSRLISSGEGKFRFLAMIKNTSSHRVSLIYINVTAMDENGRALGEFSAPALVSCLPPGKESPAIVRISGASELRNYKIRLQKDDEFDPGCLPLQLSDDRMEPDNTGFRITGRLKNLSQQVARYPEIIGVLFGADGSLMDIKIAYPDRAVLAKNEESPFVIDLDRSMERPASYRLYSNALPSEGRKD